ncbi:hypothetical protein GNI_206560, partial [Gregarina niphandrodes]
LGHPRQQLRQLRRVYRPCHIHGDVVHLILHLTTPVQDGVQVAQVFPKDIATQRVNRLGLVPRSRALQLTPQRGQQLRLRVSVSRRPLLWTPHHHPVPLLEPVVVFALHRRRFQRQQRSLADRLQLCFKRRLGRQHQSRHLTTSAARAHRNHL